MLYIVATPIGNLTDITLRALEVLKSVDLILCEDTRVSKGLLMHYEIKAQTSSYHSFNESAKLDRFIEMLEEGKNIALISDAGMPLIQDPGHLLVKACQERNISYTVIPGPSSVLNALVLSGFEINRFQFIGFLSKKNSEIKEELQSAIEYEGLSVYFESPKRLVDTLTLLSEIDPKVPCAVVREITKKFETVHKGSALELKTQFLDQEPRGEIVLIIQGTKKEKAQDLTDMAFELVENGISKKSAYQLISKIGFVDKKRLYQSSQE